MDHHFVLWALPDDLATGIPVRSGQEQEAYMGVLLHNKLVQTRKEARVQNLSVVCLGETNKLVDNT